MTDPKRELIAYTDLKRVIIDPGFCTFCGACAAACPVHAIDIDQKQLHYEDCSTYMDFCPICYDICPHTEPLITEAQRFVVSAPKLREIIGYHRKIILARSTNEESGPRSSPFGDRLRGRTPTVYDLEQMFQLT